MGYVDQQGLHIQRVEPEYTRGSTCNVLSPDRAKARIVESCSSLSVLSRVYQPVRSSPAKNDGSPLGRKREHLGYIVVPGRSTDLQQFSRRGARKWSDQEAGLADTALAVSRLATALPTENVGSGLLSKALSESDNEDPQQRHRLKDLLRVSPGASREAGCGGSFFGCACGWKRSIASRHYEQYP